MRWLAATISLKVSAILPIDADVVAGHAHREIADAHRLQARAAIRAVPRIRASLSSGTGRGRLAAFGVEAATADPFALAALTASAMEVSRYGRERRSKRGAWATDSGFEGAEDEGGHAGDAAGI